MMMIISKLESKQLTTYLNSRELRCKCLSGKCCVTLINNNLVTAYEKFRKLVGRPIYISSGYRCPQHNVDVRGSLYSRHMVGEAIDVLKPDNSSIETMIDFAKEAGFKYIKEYDNPKRLHLDIFQR